MGRKTIGVVVAFSLMLLLLLLIPVTTSFAFTTYNSDSVDENLKLPPPQRWSPLLKAENFAGSPPFTCDDNQKENNNTHLSRYTDRAGNTVDIYCIWNNFIVDGQIAGNESLGIMQFIGFYNNKTVIGQCPYVTAVNYYNIETDEQGIINETTWISTTPDMKHSVTYNLSFNDYNQSAMAHRNASAYEGTAAGLFWDSYS